MLVLLEPEQGLAVTAAVCLDWLLQMASVPELAREVQLHPFVSAHAYC